MAAASSTEVPPNFMTTHSPRRPVASWRSFDSWFISRLPSTLDQPIFNQQTLHQQTLDQQKTHRPVASGGGSHYLFRTSCCSAQQATSPRSHVLRVLAVPMKVVIRFWEEEVMVTVDQFS